jgi:hypothetical protein
MVTEAPGSSLAAGAPSAPAGFLRRHRVKLVLIGLVAVVALAMGAYTAVVLTFSYSTGDRVGFVQKLSKKGWICRTWEGELAMSPVPGAAPQLFPFSIRDDQVARQITALEGKKVSLQYEEKKGLPTSCWGETPHFVTAVRAVAP